MAATFTIRSRWDLAMVVQMAFARQRPTTVRRVQRSCATDRASGLRSDLAVASAFARTGSRPASQSDPRNTDWLARTGRGSAHGEGLGARGGSEPGPGQDAPYPREATIGAVLLTIFMPFITLIAALILRAQELRPARREQLKNWALASGAWLATDWVIGTIIFASALSAIGPSGCKGGIDQSVPPSYESSDGTHWVGTFTCMNGGTITKPAPASQVPGGG